VVTLRRPVADAATPDRHDDGGFTLVEMLMALFILTVVMVASVGVLSSSFLSVAFSRQQQEASFLMNQQMERIRSLAPSSIASYSAPAPATVNGTTYSYSWNSASGGTGYEWVEVTVAWSKSDRNGVPAQVTDQELLCDVASC
jgi:prepilin-type N-terminal cleavage/methylation domain-containing protein